MVLRPGTPFPPTIPWSCVVTTVRKQVPRVLEGLLQISNFVGSVMLLDDILDHIARITSDIMQVPVCSIYLMNEEKELVLRSNVGFERELLGVARFALGEGIPGWIALENQTIALTDATTHPRYKPIDSAIELGCRAYLAAPLRIQEEIIGVMTARKTEVYEFSRDEILFFETVCKQVAIVIEKARMYESKLTVERLAAVAISLSGVAHYIKNVLLTMKGGEYLVDNGLAQGQLERAREGWSVLKRANRKIRGLVENMLNFSRQSQLILRPVNLNSMVIDMLRSLEELAHERGVELVPALDGGIDEVSVDPESFYDVLLNLTTNAIEAMPEGRGGKVVVRTSRLDGRHQLLIEVIDNGTGIPLEIQDRVFNLFFSTKGKRGTGIGLAATRKIVEEHGGTIEFSSTPGAGTHFKVYMPTGRNE